MMEQMIDCLKRHNSYNCYSGGISYLIECSGIDMPEYLSFGLSKGLNFDYEITENTLSFKAVRSLHCLTDFIYSTGVTVTEMNSQVDKIDDELIVSRIKSNKPLMFDYDGYYMPFTPIYLKEHEKRICLIVGYTDEEYIISDFIYGVYEHKVKKTVLLESINSEEAMVLAKNWYEVSTATFNETSLEKENVYNAILDVTQHFMQHVVSKSKNVIKDFAVDLKKVLLGQLTGLEISEISEDLKQLNLTLEHYGLFLDHANRKYFDNDVLFGISKNLEEATVEWKKVCRLIYKYSINANASVVDKIVVRVNSVAERLEVSFTELNLLFERGEICIS